MNRYHSVRFNFLMNFILTISNFIFPLLTFPYVSRVLGASGVGTVTFATSIISYFSMVGMLGIPTYGIRACAKVRDNEEKLDKTVQEIMLLNALVMLLALVALTIAVATVPKLSQEKLLYLLMSSTLVFNVLGVDWLYKALERYSYITVRSIVFKLLSLILMFLLVKNSGNYVIYGGLTVFAAVGSNLLNFLNLRRIVHLKPMKNLDLKQHLKPTLSFFLLTVSSTIYLNVDTTILGFVKGDTEVGYYSAAVKVKQILVSIVTSLGAVLLPRLSFYFEKKRHEDFKYLVQKALNFVFVVAVPLVVYFIITSKESILFLSGDAFLPAVLPMQLILPTVLFIGLSNLMGMQILVPTNREKLVVLSTVIGAVLDILLNIFLIPLLGASGAAIASTAAELSVALVQLYFLRELVLPMFKNISLAKIAISAGTALLFTLILKGLLSVGTFLMLVCTAFAFFAVYGVLLLLMKEAFTTEMVASLLEKLT
ncbi:flippase [Streptococcus pantholopis]|uniref:Flippase n=1 Tax=Streptococcus pantholopis TaxID=1811193 RepID=A0A172Q7T7_9STRE|nr:flippase [Streptococcus pantholopis]AND79465.1 flippase [Streptococcus pantholopis]